MTWLGIILVGNLDNDLLNIRFRALDAVRMAAFPQSAAFVPVLPPDKYQTTVNAIYDYIDEITKQESDYQQQIRDRKAQELVIKVGIALNDNIIESGRLLSDFVQANVAQQHDLTGYYQTIISQKQNELENLNTSIDKLQTNLTEQQQEVNTAIEDYKNAVNDWKRIEEIEIGLKVAGAIFSIAETIGMPEKAGEEFTELIKVFIKIKRIMEILEKTFIIYQSVNAAKNELNDANDALDDLSDNDLDINANTTWDEMSVNFSLLMAKTPNGIKDPKDTLNAAFIVLVLRGKALTIAKSNATQLARDIYNQQRMEEITKTQQNRFDQIQTSLKPENVQDLDPSTPDLAGMTGSLMIIRSQMQGILVRTFVLQDQALQYQDLQPATPITAFDLLSMKGAKVTQSQNTIIANNALGEIQPTITTPIALSIEIPVAKLTGGNVFPLPILLDNAVVLQYMDVRVQAVMLKVKSGVATDTESFFVKLQYDGNPFYVRAPAGHPVVFNTPLRERTYEFEVGSNEPKFQDGGMSWSEDVSLITPFSTWNISFPETKELNMGLLFKDATINITISFTLKARITTDVSKHSFARSMAEFAPGLVNRPSLEELVSNMAGKTVTNGWDVVFNMSLSEIQNALNKQFDELKKDTSYGGIIN